MLLPRGFSSAFFGTTIDDAERRRIRTLSRPSFSSRYHVLPGASGTFSGTAIDGFLVRDAAPRPCPDPHCLPGNLSPQITCTWRDFWCVFRHDARWILDERRRTRTVSRPLFASRSAPIAAPNCWYRGTSLIRKRLPVGPCNRPMPMALWFS